jgi:hypothetical protein
VPHVLLHKTLQISDNLVASSLVHSTVQYIRSAAVLTWRTSFTACQLLIIQTTGNHIEVSYI